MRRITIGIILFLSAASAFSHCDWIKGPVVEAAQQALARNDVALVLPWIAPADEREIRDAFSRTMKVRAGGDAARELADRWFFETVVRVHRRAEGEPYEGLRGDDYKPEPGIEHADEALKAGSIDGMQRGMTDAVSKGLRERYNAVVEAKKHASDSVDAGRRYVATYVEWIHYVERLHKALHTPAHAHAQAAHDH